MLFEITIQFRVDDFPEGRSWYERLFQRKPDFEPHAGIAEWEMIPGSWLQLAQGTPIKGSGPLRLGVPDIEREKDRLIRELEVENFTVNTRDEVPVYWATFADPWGNDLGLFEYKNKGDERERVSVILGKEYIE
nr:VOC family protein [Salinibacillus kushneri]